MSGELKPENFEVVADRDGEMSLRCALYGDGCWWDADIRDGRPDAGLGSLLEVAREHIRTAHVPVIEGEASEAPHVHVYLAVHPTKGIFWAGIDRNEARKQARDMGSLVARVPVVGDYRVQVDD